MLLIPALSLANPRLQELELRDSDPCRQSTSCATRDVAGYVYYEAEDYGKALTAWEEAYALIPVPRLLLSQARALFRLGSCQRAEALYLRYLKEDPSGFYRAFAEEWLAELRASPLCAPPPLPQPPVPRVRERRRAPAWPFLLGGGVIAALTIGLSLALTPIPHLELEFGRRP